MEWIRFYLHIILDRIYPGETKAKDGFTGQAGFFGFFLPAAETTENVKKIIYPDHPWPRPGFKNNR